MNPLLLGLTVIALQVLDPCAAAPQTVPTKGHAIGWCHDMRDDAGLTLPFVSFRLTINGQVFDLGQRSPVSGPGSATGLFYFEAPLPIEFNRGIWPVYMEAYNSEGTSPPSTTIAWQIGGPPNRPANPQIKQQGTP